MIKTYYSHGKLLITGEYLVLDGALALALPTRYGQSMTVEQIDSEKIIWISKDVSGSIWYEGHFEIADNKFKTNLNDPVSNTLQKLFEAAKTLNPKFYEVAQGKRVTCELEFSRNWGLGSSSTLITNFAEWAAVDAFELSDRTLGGSGYDIGCAKSDSPILFRRNNTIPQFRSIKFDPVFKDNLFFVHLNRKQNSREAISAYNRLNKDRTAFISAIDKLTHKILKCSKFEEFTKLIEEHEVLISGILNQPTVKSVLFSDFKGAIKSLGAWGGDFILVATEDDPMAYFKSKGYSVIIPFSEMVL